jgi:hypothetical protein
LSTAQKMEEILRGAAATTTEDLAAQEQERPGPSGVQKITVISRGESFIYLVIESL